MIMIFVLFQQKVFHFLLLLFFSSQRRLPACNGILDSRLFAHIDAIL